MCSDVAPVVSVKGLSKHYAMFSKPSDRLKQMLWRGKRRFYTTHKALEDVSFDVLPGEAIGIIGHNGSGKSTLLQLICGTLTATGGTVSVSGRVAALLELGAGFNPEFTGRENVFLYGAVLGLSQQEMEAKYDEICAFADIGEFINQPLTSYSSGMVVRLAFAVSTAVEPDILIVDEALAVGDEAFQRKCYGRIQELRDKGCTLLFVSHSVVAISELCSRVLMMDRGNLISDGVPAKLIAQYQSLLHASPERRDAVRHSILNQEAVPDADDDNMSVPDSCVTYPENGARIDKVAVKDADGSDVCVLKKGEYYYLQYNVTFLQRIQRPQFGVMIRTMAGADLAGGIAPALSNDVVEPGDVVHVRWGFENRLNQGVYFVSVGCTHMDVDGEVMLHRIVDAVEVRALAAEGSISTGRIDMQWDLNATLDIDSGN